MLLRALGWVAPDEIVVNAVNDHAIADHLRALLRFPAQGTRTFGLAGARANAGAYMQVIATRDRLRLHASDKPLPIEGLVGYDIRPGAKRHEVRLIAAIAAPIGLPAPGRAR